MRTLLTVAILLLACVAEASEYLVRFQVNYRSAGNYIVYEKDGQLYAEQALFERLNIPVKEDTPLTVLEKHGKIEFNRERQTLVFIPNNPNLFREHQLKGNQKPDLVIKHENSIKDFNLLRLPFTFKGIDYQIGYLWNKDSRLDYQVTLTGRIWNFDADLRLYSRDKGNFSLQWHDKGNKYIRDIQIGYIPLLNLHGISLTNEPHARFTDEFGMQDIYVFFPIGTRLEVFRHADYIGTFTVDSSPYRITLDLFYGTNEFRIIAYRPDGVIKEEIITKTVDNFLVRKGSVEYLVAYGKRNKSNIRDYKARISYGLLNNLTTTAETSRDYSRLSVHWRPSEQLLLQPKLYTDGLGISAWYANEMPVNVSLLYLNREKVDNLSFNIALRTLFSPSFSHSSVRNIQNGAYVNTTTDRIRAFFSYKNLFISPYAEWKTIETQSIQDTYRTHGLTSLALLPHRFKAKVELKNKKNVRTNRDIFSIDASIIRQLNIGSIEVKNSFKENYQQPLKLEKTEVIFNFHKFRYASINLRASYNHISRNHGIFAGITGSITRAGMSNRQQSNRALIYVRPFLDENQNGYYDDGEDIVYTNVLVENRNYKTNGDIILINDLTPYRTYTLHMSNEIDAEPKYHTISVTPTRGSIAVVNVPFYEIAEIDGYIESRKDGVTVILLVEGKEHRRTKTRFGGYYHFRIPAYMKDKAAVKVF